jgi:hypothetical protein
VPSTISHRQMLEPPGGLRKPRRVQQGVRRAFRPIMKKPVIDVLCSIAPAPPLPKRIAHDLWLRTGIDELSVSAYPYFP